MGNLQKLLASFEEMEKSRKRLHKSVHQVYLEETEKYEQWRKSEECIRLIKSQLEILGECCPICFEDLALEKATIDHLEPKRDNLSRTLDSSNLLVMCWGCNQAKYSTPFKQWRQLLHKSRRDSLDYAITRIHGKAKLESLIS